MSGAAFTLGQTEVRPGVYVNIQNGSTSSSPSTGIVAAMFQASWGPLGVATTLNTYDAVEQLFGSFTSGNETLDAAQQAFLGGAQQVLAYRIGTTDEGAAKATTSLVDTADPGVSCVTITALYEGVRGNNLGLIIRTNLTDATKRDFLIYEGTTLRQTITYTPGNTDEAAALVAAVTATGSPWVTATKLAIGTGTLAPVGTIKSLVGGVNPTVTPADYSTAATAIETEDWDILVCDSNTNAVQVTLQGYIDRVRNDDGNYVMAVFGEPTSVSLSSRLANALAFNDPAIVYVANGFVTNEGTTIEGYRAAARIAGIIAGTAISRSITHFILTDAATVSGPLANSDVISAIQNGALVFTRNASNQVQVEYGITTLVNPPLNLDAGWKKIRRVRGRDFLIESIIGAWDPLVGQVNNNIGGQNALVQAATSIIGQLINQGVLSSGTCTLDPQRAPAGDSVWFTLNIVDNDSAEHIYEIISFNF